MVYGTTLDFEYDFFSSKKFDNSFSCLEKLVRFFYRIFLEGKANREKYTDKICIRGRESSHAFVSLEEDPVNTPQKACIQEWYITKGNTQVGKAHCKEKCSGVEYTHKSTKPVEVERGK